MFPESLHLVVISRREDVSGGDECRSLESESALQIHGQQSALCCFTGVWVELKRKHRFITLWLTGAWPNRREDVEKLQKRFCVLCLSADLWYST